MYSLTGKTLRFLALLLALVSVHAAGAMASGEDCEAMGLGMEELNTIDFVKMYLEKGGEKRKNDAETILEKSKYHVIEQKIPAPVPGAQ